MLSNMDVAGVKSVPKHRIRQADIMKFAPKAATRIIGSGTFYRHTNSKRHFSQSVQSFLRLIIFTHDTFVDYNNQSDHF